MTRETAVQQYAALTLAAACFEVAYRRATINDRQRAQTMFSDTQRRADAFARDIIAQFGVHAAYSIFRQAGTIREGALT